LLPKPKSKVTVSQKVVTPVKTGVQIFRDNPKHWIPASAGMTG